MQELFLRFYRNTFKIISDFPYLMKNIENDFLHFKSPSKVSSPDFVITAIINKMQDIFPPKGRPWIKTREYTCYERNREKKIFYRWGDIIILNNREKFALVYSRNLTQLHETVYTLLLAVTGEHLEKQGYYRIHALGFSKNHKGGLVISALGGGKTTLALELMNRGDFKILSEDTPARILAPTSIVSGLSVLSRRVTQGTLRMQASSWTPPESVRISLALLSSWRKPRKSVGSISLISCGLRPNLAIIFWERGWMG